LPYTTCAVEIKTWTKADEANVRNKFLEENFDREIIINNKTISEYLNIL
jgi:hypothetical protein